ncbi:MAG: hypothetical protein L0332_16625 [Chloroflexi bacterium]|nr:hypothetical protein [Chloroflexota bacterium]MCI0579129.1 hypothetical protein [Chloroflexota bacterium]MCI0643346.1 hypothetical protein [Chloroflexota bacterium]MCI0728325.1 hypothetical protein [Chloroflexota bacterium]
MARFAKTAPVALLFIGIVVQNPDYPFQFVFEDGILVDYTSPRTRLDEITAYYGPPAEVVWQIPKIGYHGSSPYTYLIFPE